MQYKSKKSLGISEDPEIIRDNASCSKMKKTSKIKLSEKRERTPESSDIQEKSYKEKKISESQKEFMEVNEMSLTQIGREKEKIKKEIEKNQKKLNYLEIYEKLKNEMNKEIQKALIKESRNSKFNFDKDKVFKIIKEVSLNIYKKKEKSLNSQVKSQIKEDMDNMLDQINNMDNLNIGTVLSTQYFGTNNKNTEINEINLDENKDLINKEKSIRVSEIQKNNKKEKNDNSELKKSSKSQKVENIILNDSTFFENSKKTIVKNPSQKSKIYEYSYRCLTNNLNFAIQKGMKRGIFSIEIENNGLLAWPQNKTFLEIDNSKSSIKNIQKFPLSPLNSREKTSLNILVNHMDKYKPSKQCIYLDFKVDGKKYGESILLNIEVTENINKIKFKSIIKAFRDDFDFTTSVFSDTAIGNALAEYQNFEDAEVTIFEDRFKYLSK